ncbi:Ku protein [Pseudaminobacter soli (ex Li et al. 2025)]|uniref:Non-homologous end joining protein Ku n=1 Tax=Pseudaminobacter soli (ex Li et al. 2025) TaxID=1295366 RepID=A0A2P7RMH8_9HYPH|nr:Ku protein [Mesorhizobium soli]PSJ51428.1 Ku protein [Mesorhizobium soli]
MSNVRSLWKGFMRLGNVTCGVKIVGAWTEAETIHFRILNRETRGPVKSEYIDEGTGKPVDAEDQVKGYEINKNEYLLLEPAEIDTLKPLSNHVLTIENFVDVSEVEAVYRDKPYYLVPADKLATDPFALLREAMRRTGKAALATVVLWQRERHVLIEPLGKGMVMTLLNSAKQIVPEKKAFDEMGTPKIDPEMTDIASLIIDKKVTHFDPSKFEDHYEEALKQLIESKRTGAPPPKPSPEPKENVKDLAGILRKSLEVEGLAPPKGRKPKAKTAH